MVDKTLRSIYARTLVITFTLVCACSGLKQPAMAQPESAPERRLIEKRIANEEAQAEYYREQTKKLLEPAKTKTFWDNIKDNPASALGVVGAALVALVALVSFIFNYMATLRNQQDTQFYEALKRFGDTDSPAARSSAAGILAQMSMRKTGVRKRRRPYYETAFNQLTAGLHLEESATVLTSIADALKQAVPANPSAAAHKLYEQNIKLQDRLAVSLADFFTANAESSLANVTDIKDDSWGLSATVTGYGESVIRTLVERHGHEKFTKLLRAAATVMTALQPEQKIDNQIKKRELLRVRAGRLKANVEALAAALRSVRLYGPPAEIVRLAKSVGEIPEFYERVLSMRLNGVFLVGADMNDAILKNISMVEAQLQATNWSMAKLNRARLFSTRLEGAVFEGTNLSEADLSWAKLQGTNLNLANLKKAKLYAVDLSPLTIEGKAGPKVTSLIEAELDGTDLRSAVLNQAVMRGVSVNEETNIGSANWWAADFISRFEGIQGDKIDEKLIERLLALSGEKTSFFRIRDKEVVFNLNVHPSVRTFIEAKYTSAGPEVV